MNTFYGAGLPHQEPLAPFKNQGCFYCSLPPEALEQLSRIPIMARYPARTVLFAEGQRARGVFVLCCGRAKLSSCTVGGKSVILMIVEPNGALGLAEALVDRPCDSTAEVMTPSDIHYIPVEDLYRVLLQCPEAAFRIAQQLSEDYSAVCQELRLLSLSCSASERIAHLLLRLSVQQGNRVHPDADTRVAMNLTHEEIAQFVCTSRETVTRTFSAFKKKRLIDFSGSTLIVRNQAALERMAARR